MILLDSFCPYTAGGEKLPLREFGVRLERSILRFAAASLEILEQASNAAVADDTDVK